MTQRESANVLRSRMSSSGYISNSDKFPIRRVLLELKVAIATSKKRRYTRKDEASIHDIVVLPCVRLAEADKVECPGIPPSGYKWQKSVEDIPRFIQLIGVVDLLANTAIPIVTWSKAKSRLNSRFNKLKNSPIATFKSEGDKTYLYVMKSSLKAVSLSIIPEDYAEAVSFPKCGEIDQDLICNPLEIDIGADYSTLDQASELVMRNESVVHNIKPDEENNSNSLS